MKFTHGQIEHKNAVLKNEVNAIIGNIKYELNN